MKYREEKGLSHLDLKIPNIRYDGIVKYIELYKTDRWYASIVIDVKEQQESALKGNLYIDLGIKNLATVFDGKKVAIYSGGNVSSTNRYRNKKAAEQQAILSTIGKRTSKEKRQIARKALHQLKQQLHSMTKAIVQTAKAESKGIVIGDLSHIRDSANYNDNANQKIHQWQFAEITKQFFYKAKEFGVKITKISDEDTSKTCALCGQETNGRVHRGLYRCKLFGKQFNADANGALNIMKGIFKSHCSKAAG